MKFKPEKRDNILGPLIAVVIIGSWFFLLKFLLTQEVLVALPGIIPMTFLYTGLFITAHDSMHGIIMPSNRYVNRFLGQLALTMYAFFSFEKLVKKHHEHHRNPATDLDPDFHAEGKGGFWLWYLRFMFNYLSIYQIIGMAIVFNILFHLLNVELINLILFWILPAFLSTFQLFYFGTYLPHREQIEGYKDQHRSISNDYPVLLSFITCYHFGYHWEHHEYPYVAWWKLPKVRKEVRMKTA